MKLGLRLAHYIRAELLSVVLPLPFDLELNKTRGIVSDCRNRLSPSYNCRSNDHHLRALESALGATVNKNCTSR
jgi:hypothetical protein